MLILASTSVGVFTLAQPYVTSLRYVNFCQLRFHFYHRQLADMKPVRASNRAASKGPNLKNKKKSDQTTRKDATEQVRYADVDSECLHCSLRLSLTCYLMLLYTFLMLFQDPELGDNNRGKSTHPKPAAQKRKGQRGFCLFFQHGVLCTYVHYCMLG